MVAVANENHQQQPWLKHNCLAKKSR